MRTMASSPSRPAANAAPHSGRSRARRAMVTRPSARALDRLAFQHNQCSGERMPTPSQPPVSSSARTAATSRATATFTVPITATASPSANRHAASCGERPVAGGGAGASARRTWLQRYSGGVTVYGERPNGREDIPGQVPPPGIGAPIPARCTSDSARKDLDG